MWENVIVCGGSSMFPGFVERLQKELVALSPDNTTPVVKAAENRFNVTHKGASNLAYYEEFYDWSITLDDYEIDGEEVFDTKCIN
jgi:actin-related protein